MLPPSPAGSTSSPAAHVAPAPAPAPAAAPAATAAAAAVAPVSAADASSGGAAAPAPYPAANAPSSPAGASAGPAHHSPAATTAAAPRPPPASTPSTLSASADAISRRRSKRRRGAKKGGQGDEGATRVPKRKRNDATESCAIANIIENFKPTNVDSEVALIDLLKRQPFGCVFTGEGVVEPMGIVLEEEFKSRWDASEVCRTLTWQDLMCKKREGSWEEFKEETITSMVHHLSSLPGQDIPQPETVEGSVFNAADLSSSTLLRPHLSGIPPEKLPQFLVRTLPEGGGGLSVHLKLDIGASVGFRLRPRNGGPVLESSPTGWSFFFF